MSSVPSATCWMPSPWYATRYSWIWLLSSDALVDRDADLAAGTGHRLRLQAGELALDVEIADFAEVEDARVEIGPFAHAAAMHVVRQVVDVGEARARRMLVDAGQRDEVDVVDRHIASGVGGRARIAVDEVDQRIADALDRGNVEFHRPRTVGDAPRALLDRLVVRGGGIRHAEGDGADRRAVHARERLREGIRLGVDDEVDVPLPIEQHILRPMPRDRREAHLLEQVAKRGRIGRRVLDELEAVGSERVFPKRRTGSGHGRLPKAEKNESLATCRLSARVGTLGRKARRMACILLMLPACCQRPEHLGAARNPEQPNNAKQKSSDPCRPWRLSPPPPSPLPRKASAHLRQHRRAIAAQCGEPGLPGDPDRRIRRPDPVRRHGPRAAQVTLVMSDWALASTYGSIEPDVGPSDHAHAVQRRQFRREPGTGTVIATQTNTYAIPWRPEADPTCPNPTSWRASNDNCYNGYAFQIVSTSPAPRYPSRSSTASRTTRTWGYAPIGHAGPVRIAEFRPGASAADDRGNPFPDTVYWNTAVQRTTRTAARAESPCSAQDTGLDAIQWRHHVRGARRARRYCKARCRARSTDRRNIRPAV